MLNYLSIRSVAMSISDKSPDEIVKTQQITPCIFVKTADHTEQPLSAEPVPRYQHR